MKRILTAIVVLGLVAFVLVLPAPAWAWGHGGHGGSCCFFGGFAAGLFTGAVIGGAFAPVYAYPAPVYAYPAPVYAYPAPVYSAPPAPAPATPPATWYYCRSAGAYYPSVPSCPEAWVPVVGQ